MSEGLQHLCILGTVWIPYLSCLDKNVAGPESWKWKGGRRDSWHRGLLLSESRAHQAASWARWAGIRGWVRLPREGLHPILQQSPCGEEGKAPPRAHEWHRHVVSTVWMAWTGCFITAQILSHTISQLMWRPRGVTQPSRWDVQTSCCSSLWSQWEELS